MAAEATSTLYQGLQRLNPDLPSATVVEAPSVSVLRTLIHPPRSVAKAWRDDGRAAKGSAEAIKNGSPSEARFPGHRQEPR
jgi:hypothetical protein